MPFTTNTVGGSWLGGGTKVDNCDRAAQAAITTAFGWVAGKLPQMTALGGELARLATDLATKTVASVDIDCRGCKQPRSTDGSIDLGTDGGNGFNLCADVLPPNDQELTNVAVLWHLVSLCGGKQLDKQAVTARFGYAWNLQDNPSLMLIDTDTVPGGWLAGRYTVWLPTTGEVRVKVLSGGSWLSGPTVAPGNQVHPPDPTWTYP